METHNGFARERSTNPNVFGDVYRAATAPGLSAGTAERLAEWAEEHAWRNVRRILTEENACHHEPALRAAYYGDQAADDGHR